MKLVPIRVECYAGHKADETPRRFEWEEHWIEIAEVLDRWYQGAGDPEWPIADYFKLLGADGHEYLLKHDRDTDQWHLARKW